MTASFQVEATVATPEFVTVPLQQQQQDDEKQPHPPLRSCLAGSFGSTPLSRSASRRRVRLTESDPVVHEPPQALSESLQPNGKASLWYTGAEIRRIKQAAVPILTRLDHHQSVPTAIEVDWRTGTTSTRGLEFGSKVGQQRKRASLQFQRLVLQEQARLRQQQQDDTNENNENAVQQQLAACAAKAALPAVDLALQIAVEDAAFVCNYIENVPQMAAAPTRTPPVVVTVLRRMFTAARQNVVVRQQRSRRLQKQQTTLQQKGWKKEEDMRARCDTESTTTIMAACS